MENETTTTATETAETNTETAENKAGAQVEKSTEKTFTQADVEKIVSTRISRESERWEKKLSESQKLAKMNADQKAQYEKEKAEKKLAEREAEITKRELTATAKETLIEKGLPVELSATLNYADADSCNKSIEAVEKAFRTALQKAVDEKIKSSGGSPKSSETKATDPFLEGLGLIK